MVVATQTTNKYGAPDSSNAPLRVLFVSHTYVVGVNQGKLEAIANAGVEVGLLVPQHWKALQWNKRFEVETPYPQIAIYASPVWFEGRGGAHFYPLNSVWQAIRDFRPDIIQIEEEVFSLTTFEISCFARLHNIPVVVFGWENMDRHLHPIRQWMRQFVFNTADAILAGNKEGADLLHQWGYQKVIEVMPQMGVDTDLFSPSLRTHRNSNDDVLRIGFVGRIVYQKGIDTLLEAGQILRQAGHRFHLCLCGSGSDEAEFRELAQTYDLDDIITWRGGVRHDEVPQEIGTMDALVLPSRSVHTWKEQFGHVLIEAMAVGIPVVGSTCGEIPNVIGRSDLVFAENDAQELADVLARLIQEHVWRQEMGQYSLERVAQQYSHQRIAQKSIDLWQIILQSRSS